jgi:hypothetical protein
MRTSRSTPGAVAYRILARRLAGLPDLPSATVELAAAERAAAVAGERL